MIAIRVSLDHHPSPANPIPVAKREVSNLSLPVCQASPPLRPSFQVLSARGLWHRPSPARSSCRPADFSPQSSVPAGELFTAGPATRRRRARDGPRPSPLAAGRRRDPGIISPPRRDCDDAAAQLEDDAALRFAAHPDVGRRPGDPGFVQLRGCGPLYLSDSMMPARAALWSRVSRRQRFCRARAAAGTRSTHGRSRSPGRSALLHGGSGATRGLGHDKLKAFPRPAP